MSASSQHLRRPLAGLSHTGISFLQRKDPWMAAWWSATFPGFGHYLNGQFLRGTFLTLSEVITNTLGHINEAIVYSFCGRFEEAQAVAEPQWVLGYIIIYFYAIWDSYRGALWQNKMCDLAENEDEPLSLAIFHPYEHQYIEQKKPGTAAFYSFLFPGLGQLYNHQMAIAIWAVLWWWIYLFLSGAPESLIFLIQGQLQQSVAVLQPQWLLFMPSVAGGSVYYAYITAIGHNRLFRLEQRQHLLKRYQNPDIALFP